MTNLVIRQPAKAVIATKSVTIQIIPMTAKQKIALPPEVSAAMKPEAIGHRLRLLRLALGMSPSEMADDLGIERTYWSRFENGRRAITDTFAALLVARHGVTLDFLILGRWDKLPLDLANAMRAADRS